MGYLRTVFKGPFVTKKIGTITITHQDHHCYLPLVTDTSFCFCNDKKVSLLDTVTMPTYGNSSTTLAHVRRKLDGGLLINFLGKENKYISKKVSANSRTHLYVQYIPERLRECTNIRIYMKANLANF